MADHYTAYAIPFFLLFIGLESLFFWFKRNEPLRVNDTLTNLSCGIVTAIFEVFTKWALFLFFDFLVRSVGIWEWAVSSWKTWLTFFFVYDFFYYWGHRIAHSVNFMWGGHLPHHQSEEYNFSVALRQGALQDTLNFPVFLPMALMGCPIEVFAGVLLANKFFQFWIHTQAIGKVPFIEGILNTPSAHRVHHAVNPCYVDRNHGGFIMIWDRIFGTWAEERDEEPVVFGVRKPYRSWDPLFAHVEWWVRLWKDSLATARWSDKFKLWVMPTGWRPRDVSQSDPWEPYDIENYKKYDPLISTRRKVAAVMLFLVTVPMISHLLYEQFNMAWGDRGELSMLILVCLYLCGKLLTPSGAPAKESGV